MFAIVLTGCSSQKTSKVEKNSPKNTEIDILNTDDSKELTSDELEIDLEIEETLEEIENNEWNDETEDILAEEMIDTEINKAVEEIEIDENYELVRELENLEDGKRTGEASKGSCDLISESSSCLGYYGSFWTKPQMELNCGDGGTFSLKPCPLDSLGGCNIGNGDPGDTVIWFYNRGGSPHDGSIQSNINVCNDNPMGRWINAKSGQFEN